MKKQFLDDIGLEELIGYIKKYVKDDRDVKPYASYSVFPKTGEQNIIYIDTTNNLTYYWDDTSKTYKALDVQTWDNLSGKPSTFPPSTHNHDDRYYTETEINSKLAGKANSSHTHKKTDITDFPTSMPASDVKAWAKADTKPTYTKSEVGLGNVDNTADKDKSVKYATSAGAASSVDWSGVKNKPGTYPPSAHNHNIESLTNFDARVYDAAGTRAANTVLAAPSGSDGTARFRQLVAADLPSHTHNYAGSASAGGAADSSLSLFINPSTRQTSGDYDLTSSIYAYKVTHSIASSIMKTGKPPEDSHILTFGWDSFAGWGAQLAIGSSKGNHLYIRGANSKQKTVDSKTVNYSEWDSDWRTILDSGNYTSYAATKSHTHDDRYYTENEMDTKLSGKSNTNHTHDLSTMINTLTEGSSTPTDNDYYITQYVGGGTTTKTYHRRPHSALWTYIKGKSDSVYQPKGNYAASSHTHSISDITNLKSSLDSKLSLSGGTITGQIKRSAGGNWVADRDHAAVFNTLGGGNGYQPVVGQKTATGSWTVGNLGNNEALVFNYCTDANYKTGNNTSEPIYLPPQAGTIITSATIGGQSVNYANSAGKLSTSRTISLTGSVTGSGNFDGSGNLTISTATSHTHNSVADINSGATTTFAYSKAGMGYGDFTWLAAWNGSELRAVNKSLFATAGHTHSYLPLSGGTMGGTAFIEWADSGNWNNSNKNVTFPVNRGGLQWMGQSDYVKLFAQETSSDNLELVLQFGDDNSNGLSIRNYAGNETARITASGGFTGTFYGNASTATTATNAYYLNIVANNEIRFNKPSSALGNDNSLYIGYKWADGTSSKMINEYRFCDGGNQYAQVTASQFNGSLNGNANTSTTAAKLGRGGNTGVPMTFNWSGQSGQPTWLWGGNDGSNMYVYNPSNFSVNYAKSAATSSSCSGNASTASKLATARNIALGGLSSGSANFDGSGNVTINDWGYGVTKYVTRDSASAPYYRVAYCEVKGSYIDKSVIFTIDSGCNDGGFGIVKVCLRSNNTTTAGQTYCEVSWLIRQGFSADQLLVKVNSPAGTSTVQYADLYFKATGTYNGITVKSLSSTSQRDTVERAWTFTNPGSENCRAQPNIRTYTATYTGCDAGTASYANKLQTARTIFGKSFDGTADVAGKGFFYGTKSNADGRYANSALEIRENNLVGNTQSDFVYAPSIGFHWSNRVAGFMALHTDGNFYFRKQNGNDRATIDANLNGNASTASYASSAGSVAWGNVSGRPSSMPASDVYAWAKASSKPSYSWGEITGKPSSFTPSSHTHNYLPLSGGTMTGNINYTARGNSYIGSGEQDNAEGPGGKLNNLVISSWWGVSFTTSCAGQTYSNKTAIGIDCRNGTLRAARVDAGSFNGYTINASVPSGAKFTDTNTWRGIQNNLSSDSTTESLSAAQGKRLKGLVDGKAPMNAIHNLNYGIAIPTSDMNSNGAQNTIYPAKYENGAYSKTTGVSTYANRNNTVSIGTSANMFGDIYLAGGITSLGVYNLTTTTNLPVSVTSQGYLRRYKSGSSLMIKNHIYKIGYDEAKELLNTNVYSFRYNDDGQPANGKEHAAIDRYGFVLEDMEKTFPMAVEYDEDGLPAAWCVQIIVPTILEIVKHQQVEISALKAENEELKEKISEIDNLKKNLDELRVLIVNK